MAYSVDWVTKLITIPLVDLVWSTGNTYELALSDFLSEIRRLEYAFNEGLWAPQILDHTNPKTISGVTYAAVDEIITANGYTIQFSGSPDAVILKGSNNNILDVYVFNGVSVAPNNSAGLQDLSTILIAAYNAEVCISITYGQSGTSIPIGTRAKPSNNWPHVLAIANSWGINKIRILEAITLDITAQFSGHEFVCDNAINGLVTILPDAGVIGCTFKNLTITGTLDGDNIIRECSSYNLIAISGMLHQVSLTGFTQVESGGLLNMMDCHSGVPGGGAGETAEINMGGNGSLRNSNFTGGINLTNYTGGGKVSMDVNGRVTVESSCTGGDIYIRGNTWIIDDSGPGCTVHDQTINKILNQILHATGHIDQAIFIDTEKLEVGDGSINYPFNDLSIAIDHAEAENIKKFITYTDLTIDRQLKNFVIIGVGTPIIDCNNQNLDKSEIHRCVVTGTFFGSLITQECNLFGGTFNGYAENCGISANFAIPDYSTGRLKNCSTMEEGLIEPDISFGLGSNLLISGHEGGLSLSDMNDINIISKVLMSIGKVVIKPSCTVANKIIVGGIAELINESNLSIVDKTINPEDMKDIHLAEVGKRKSVGLVDTIYEKDLITPRKSFDIVKNGNGEVIDITHQ